MILSAIFVILGLMFFGTGLYTAASRREETHHGLLWYGIGLIVVGLVLL